MFRWMISLTLAAGAFVTLSAEFGIREDELRCEEAKQHLQDCCGESNEPIDCTYYPPGCDSNEKLPDLDVAEAVCIRDKSCDDLQFNGCGNPSAVTCE
jgi:hypothetical protein